jgi:hypothetical protein
MGASSTDPPANTFVLRFWREVSASGLRWRGQIDHVQSGTRARFLNLKEMLDFVQSYGVIVMAPGQSAETPETDGG